MISNYRVIKEASAAGCSALTLDKACGVIHHPLDSPSLASEWLVSLISGATVRRLAAMCVGVSVGRAFNPSRQLMRVMVGRGLQ